MNHLPLNSLVELTADGSPTLSWPGLNGTREKMHHSQGALSESVYIYHHALTQVLERHWPVRILSMGLGLGYNEWLALGEILRSGRGDWIIWSFEVNSDLRAAFARTLAPATCSTESVMTQIFEQVLSQVAARMNLSTNALRDFAAQALSEGRLQLRGAFPESATGVTEVTCVFYDAFSRQFNPELWTETGLRTQLESLISADCVFASYAATGTLNRALKSLGFRLSPRAGFAFKRESTLAIRG